MRRVWALAATFVGAVALAAGLLACAARSPSPSPSFVQDVPDDVRAETDRTWRSFVDRFEARSSCWEDVSIELVRSVDDGDARYVTADARIEIQIPTTPARYRESLVHELAHHIERTCPDFGALQTILEPMLADQGAGGWFAGASWQTTPSELFAEAVVELVLGERVRHGDEMPVDPAVVESIAQWGAGRADGSTG